MPHNVIKPTTTRGKIVKWLMTVLPVLLLAGVFVVIFFLFTVITARQEKLAEERSQAMAVDRLPTNVVLMEVKPAIIRDRINLPGEIKAWTDLELLAKIAGEVVEVVVKEGDFVDKGAVLARIDPADYRIALESVRATYLQAAADLERSQSLFAQEFIPIAELEKDQTRLAAARASLDNAELMLSRCTITAPMAGVIRRLDAKVGLLLTTGDPVARLLEIDRVKAVVGIPESDVGRVQAIDRVALVVQALGNRMVTGTKHLLASSPSSLARLYNLELALANPDHALLPGMFVRAEIVKQVVAQGLAVPLYAVVTRNDHQYVYVEEQGLAVQRPVQLGILEEWLVEVVSGLVPGDKVIVEGHREVEPGQAVNVIRVLPGGREALP